MKHFAGILVLASCMPYLVRGVSEPKYPPTPVRCVCPLNYAPVCGSDGVTYSNECLLRCANVENIQRGRSPICPVRAGPCKNYICNCNAEYEPVCGSDNQTYTNECWLRCANSYRVEDEQPTVALAYRAACSTSSCICPNSIDPVCGTDGKTYRNPCILQCFSRLNVAQQKPPINVASPGACRVENCICPKNLNEICASDNQTYLNDCLLDCRNRRLNQLGEELLTIRYRGPCTPCGCPRIRDPVCANNDVTFDNQCLFLCENDRRIAAGEPKLQLRWRGECSCGCDNTWDPVCGSNGRTYANLCWVRCENTKRYQDKNQQLTVNGRGECRPCRCDGCPRAEQPVCDSLGITHRNICYFNCNNACRKAAGLKQLSLYKYGRC